MMFGTFRGNVNIFCTRKFEAMHSENRYHISEVCAALGHKRLSRESKKIVLLPWRCS